MVPSRAYDKPTLFALESRKMEPLERDLLITVFVLRMGKNDRWGRWKSAGCVQSLRRVIGSTGVTLRLKVL
jgi:hypothetical protein